MNAAFEILPSDISAIRVLIAVGDRVGDLSPLMDAIGLAMEGSTLQRFEDEEAPDGSKWQESLRVQENGGKTLTLSARLKLSIGFVASSSSVETGTNVIYAGVQNNGATITGKNGPLRFPLPGGGFAFAQSVTIPSRRFIGVSADDLEEIEALAGDFILGDLS